MRLRPLILASMFVCLLPAGVRAADHAAPAGGVDAEAALALLKEGNARFVAGESSFPHVTEARRCETTEGGQHPIASILTCADSRVPPELVFDAGLGDLFVTRVAGNVASVDEIGTIEYGAGHLGTRLIVVMGHSKCGAVTAVVKHANVGPNIARLVAPIAPAVDEARAANPDAGEQRLINLSIRANVRRSMHDLLEQSAEIRELVSSGKAKLVGAVYDLHNGTVDWIGEHPDQTALLKGEGGEHAAAPTTDGHDAHLAAAVIKGTPAKAAAPADERGHAAEPKGEPAHGEAKPSAQGEPAAHDAPAAHNAPAAHGTPAPHGAAEPAPHGERPHATPAEKKAGSHDAAEPADAHGAEEHAAVTPTLMQRQGLLLPAAFMAAGSALSGTIVYALTGRAKAAATHEAKPTPAPAADDHAAPAPAATPAAH